MKMYVGTVTVSLEQYVFSWLMYKMCGDGNCFFRAVCLQLAHVQGRHENHMKMYVATVTVALEQYVFSWLVYKVDMTTT
jgi:uncharacterized membrane protein YcaP (DUF421 family)